MPAVVLGLYALVGVVHEMAALRFWGVVRKITKAALMPVLVVYYALTAEPVLVVAVIAIAASWIGDLCLIRKEEPTFFRLGMVAFLLSHVF
ncbi:MAG: lysoplasmalogenase family protein, partial [Propionibacteriaceae bacterium]|nr:lysoplasmalogenase family protein [Propionibacteriaceae bacterium]